MYVLTYSFFIRGIRRFAFASIRDYLSQFQPLFAQLLQHKMY